MLAALHAYDPKYSYTFLAPLILVNKNITYEYVIAFFYYDQLA